MALEDILPRFDKVSFTPRTLQINYPRDLTEGLSLDARTFFQIAYNKNAMTVLDWTNGKWKDDQLSLDFFFRSDQETRTEILAFLTLFIHEYTHRIDFLISPFGLQYYVNTFREYWRLQEFFPQALDNPNTVDKIRFLVAFKENLAEETHAEQRLKEMWEDLEPIIHAFYAWGDVSDIKPMGKFITEGWSNEIKGVVDPFGVGVPMEPITVLTFFHTFRIPGADKLWYLRPLTIFETKAVVNSILFILYLLGEKGVEECLHYYERVYLSRRSQFPQDYFFLLDLGARIYKEEDFHSLLKLRNFEMLRSILLILSTICWYALQAPPPLKGEDVRSSNPILRLWLGFMFFTGIARRKINVPFNSTAEALLYLDEWKGAGSFYQKSITEIIPSCRKVIENMIQMNQKYTWNPDVKSHFRHILELMQPHFVDRDLSYVSYLGMPDSGNPLFGCARKEDWELTYDDYNVPPAAKDWFDIRSDLFFNMLQPKEEIIKRLDKHYLAFYFPYHCKCGQGFTVSWVSRFAEEVNVTCAFCGQQKTIHRDDMHIISVHGKRE